MKDLNMIWKACLLISAAVCVFGDRRPAVSEQRVEQHYSGHHGDLSHVGHQKPEHHEEYAWSYPSYEFSYKVSDPHTHDFKEQHEVRKGDEVKGFYWLIQPDGHKRFVKYRADDKSGFTADVHYTKYDSKESEENNENKGESGEGEGPGEKGGDEGQGLILLVGGEEQKGNDDQGREQQAGDEGLREEEQRGNNEGRREDGGEAEERHRRAKAENGNEERRGGDEKTNEEGLSDREDRGIEGRGDQNSQERQDNEGDLWLGLPVWGRRIQEGYGKGRSRSPIGREEGSHDKRGDRGQGDHGQEGIIEQKSNRGQELNLGKGGPRHESVRGHDGQSQWGFWSHKGHDSRRGAARSQDKDGARGLEAGEGKQEQQRGQGEENRGQDDPRQEGGRRQEDYQGGEGHGIQGQSGREHGGRHGGNEGRRSEVQGHGKQLMGFKNWGNRGLHGEAQRRDGGEQRRVGIQWGERRPWNSNDSGRKDEERRGQSSHRISYGFKPLPYERQLY